jgi:very-short-patch-repair endonuclease
VTSGDSGARGAAPTPRAVRGARGAHGAPESVILALAARQHGVVARAQLLSRGVPGPVIDHRVDVGWLQRMVRGVYRVGPVDGPNSRAMAALLACGDGAVLRHATAATVVWGCRLAAGTDGVLEMIRRSGGRSHAGIRVHRVGSLRASDIVVRDGIRVTTPARTVLDLAASMTLAELERVVADAIARRVVTEAELRAVLARQPGQRGASRLRAVLGGGSARPRSEAEARFVRELRGSGLRMPEVDVWVGRYRVDFLWRAERLIVEIDGRTCHGSAVRFESDRRRDAELVAAGYRVIRVTWRRLVAEPRAVLVQVAQALAQR